MEDRGDRDGHLSPGLDSRDVQFSVDSILSVFSLLFTGKYFCKISSNVLTALGTWMWTSVKKFCALIELMELFCSRRSGYLRRICDELQKLYPGGLC